MKILSPRRMPKSAVPPTLQSALVLERAKRPRLDGLTGLRFFAALHVVLYHYGGGALGVVPVLAKMASTGYYAVTFFYVLSGFLLFYTYSDYRGAFRGTRRAFWIARLARIYPVYVLAFVLCVPPVMALMAGNESTIMAVGKAAVAGSAYLLMVQAWVPRLATYWNYPGWSVAVEAFFYLCFPVLHKWISPLSARGCRALIARCWLVSVATYVGSFTLTDTSEPVWTAMWSYNPVFRLPSFVIGLAIGRLFLVRLDTSETSGSTRVIVATSACGAAVCLSLCLPHVILRDTILAPAFAYMVYCHASDGGAVARLLGARPLMILGEASYGVYILQWPVFYLCVSVATKPDAWTVAMFVAALMVVSVASHRFIEVPMGRGLRRWSASSG